MKKSMGPEDPRSFDDPAGREASRWVAVDGAPDGWSPGKKLLGLTLLGRLLRGLHRAGAPGVRVFIGGEPKAEPEAEPTSPTPVPRQELPPGLQRALQEAPAGLEVEMWSGALPQEKAGEALQGNRVYDLQALQDWVGRLQHETSKPSESSEPSEPLSADTPRTAPPEGKAVDSKESLWRVQRSLWGAAGKSVAHDGLVAYYAGRPLGRLFSKVLVHTPVSPNAVTVASLVVGLAGAAVASLGTYWGFVLGAFLYWFGMVVDCVDGDIARVKICGTRLGQWLDTIADDISTGSITVGFGVGLYVASGETWVLAAGLLGGASVALTAAHVYRGLVCMNLPIDTAKYPWFFLGDKGVVFEEESKIGLGSLAYLVRRDTSSAIYFFVAVFGLAYVAFGFMVIGAVVTGVLSLIDMVVKRRAGRERREAERPREHQGAKAAGEDE